VRNQSPPRPLRKHRHTQETHTHEGRKCGQRRWHRQLTNRCDLSTIGARVIILRGLSSLQTITKDAECVCCCPKHRNPPPTDEKIQTIPLSLFRSRFLDWVLVKGGRRGKKEEGREGQARSACTRCATPTDSPRRLVLGTYSLALSTIVQGMSALCHFPSLSLSLSHTHTLYLCSATMCVIATNRYDQKYTLFETLCAHRSQGVRRRDPATEPPHHVFRTL
jgi:hypothetical protein